MCNKNCEEKIYTCGEINYATCVIYEGFIPNFSPLKEECDIRINDVIEDLYSYLGQSESLYYAGEGLNLENRTFSVVYGTTSGTALEGSWRPTWEDIEDAPEIPEPLNLVAGQNIEITGQYPNLTISSTNSSTGTVTGASINSNNLPVNSGIIQIPVATNNTLGVVRAGNGVTIDSNGLLNVSIQPTTYSAGNGLSLTGTEFSLPLTITGSGNYVQSLSPNANGLTVTLGQLPEGTSYIAGNGLTLTGNTFSLPVTVTGTGTFVQSVQQTADGITITLGTPPDTNTTYTVGTGLSLTGNTITNTAPNATHTGDVTGSTALTISNSAVTNTKMANMGAKTLKGNAGTATAQPSDLTVNQVKTMLNVGSKTLIASAFPYDVPVNGEHQIALFVKLPDSSEAQQINIPNGNFDGQQLFIEFNYYRAESASKATLNGNLINFIPSAEETIVPYIEDSNMRRVFAFWSTSNNAWMTRIIKMAE